MDDIDDYYHTTMADESVGDCPEFKSRTDYLIVVIAHFVEFPIGLFMMWVAYNHLETLKLRCYSPFLIMVGVACGAIGTMSEIGSHHYLGDFDLCKYHPNDMVHASFMFFIAALLVTTNIGVSKRGRAFPPDCCDIIYLVVTLLDVVTVAITFALPFVYAKYGPDFTQNTVFVPNQAVCGLVSAFRIWKNLGPSSATLLGGLGYFGLNMIGVIFLAVYKDTGILLLHAVIGGSFIMSQLPFGYAIYKAKDHDENGYGAIPK